MAENVILLRYGEVGLKGKNRDFFEEMLLANVASALGGLGASVSNKHGRLVVRAPADQEGLAMEALERVFGLVSFSPAFRTPLDIEAIQDAAFRVLASSAEPPFTFKVDASRAEKRFPHTSPEICRVVGTYILDQFGRDGGVSVDVHEPRFTAHVDVRSEGAYVFSQVIPGPGGLPLGSSARGLLLLSGGIDSPVAGWYMMKRGVPIEAVHFHSFPYTSEKSRQKAIDLCRSLSRWGRPVPLHVCQFGEIQTEIAKSCPDEMITIVMRRMMLRISQRIARSRDCLSLITGESVGQVASQTLESMETIGMAASMNILRPLCGFDKLEIIGRARAIGTYDVSIRPYEDCCAMFVPRNPRTRPRPEQAGEAESHLDVEGLVERAVANTETVSI